jgi:hypothetical protein
MFGLSVMAYGRMLLYAGVGLCYDCNKLDGTNKIEFKNQKCAIQNVKFNKICPRKEIRYPYCRRLGGPRGRSGRVRKILTPPAFDPGTVQRVKSRYTHCAIPALFSASFRLNLAWYFILKDPNIIMRNKFLLKLP